MATLCPSVSPPLPGRTPVALASVRPSSHFAGSPFASPAPGPCPGHQGALGLDTQAWGTGQPGCRACDVHHKRTALWDSVCHGGRWSCHRSPLSPQLFYLVSIGLCVAVVAVFGLPAFTFRENLVATALLLVLFGCVTGRVAAQPGLCPAAGTPGGSEPPWAAFSLPSSAEAASMGDAAGTRCREPGEGASSPGARKLSTE